MKPVEGCEKKKRSEGQRNLWLPSGRVVFSRARVFSAYQQGAPPFISTIRNLHPARQKQSFIPDTVSALILMILACVY